MSVGIENNTTSLRSILSAVQNLPEGAVLQEKTVSPSTTILSVTPDPGYDGLSKVTVNAMPAGTVGTPTANKGTVANNQVTVTPKVTNVTGYITGGEKTGEGVTVSASELVSGTLNITSNGTHAVTNYQSVDVNVPTGGGGGAELNSIITRTITSITNSEVTTIGSYAFASCSQLTTANFPNATAIGSSAFASCVWLNSISFPNATTIGYSAFASCSRLTTVYFPNATSMGSYAFRGCSNLTTVSFPKATTTGSGAFYQCYSLATVSFPKATTIGSSAFYACYSLATVSFPNATTIGSGAFYRCSNLITAIIGSNSAKRATFYSSAFYDCTMLSHLEIQYTSVASLSNSNVFSYCTYIQNALTTGSACIFVPTSLVATYKASTNWAYFSKIISAI